MISLSVPVVVTDLSIYPYQGHSHITYKLDRHSFSHKSV